MPTPYSAVIPHCARCFPEYLRAAGYYCTNNHKTDYQFDPPFTVWDELGKTAHWRNRPDPDQPFFAVFNPTMTHESGMWPENTPEIKFDPAAIKLPPYFPDTPKMREACARMYTNIEFNDGIMGTLLGQLDEDGLAGNTIVFHWSDHGPLPRGKRWPYDSGIRIPMIVRWPGMLKAGSVSDRLVSTVDLGPTVLSLAGVEIPRHMQGKAFLGDQDEPPREHVFASRDRHDEAHDMVRAARDKRFKYMRHYRPDLPYLPWIPYRNRHPILQEMWRLYQAGELTGPQLAMFRDRPVEEVYDTKADPHEINNLAADPRYAKRLSRMRAALDKWQGEVGDMGEIPESEMVRGWYPNGERPKTAGPICEASPETSASREEGAFAGPVVLQLHSATQGASIGYALEEGESPRWNLYTAPIPLPAGTTEVRARAIRIGYFESEEVSAVFEVT